jgi:hypothetical protein
MVENFYVVNCCISVQFLTLRVGDDLLDGVVEDFRTRSIFIRNPPSFDDGQFAFVFGRWIPAEANKWEKLSR